MTQKRAQKWTLYGCVHTKGGQTRHIGTENSYMFHIFHSKWNKSLNVFSVQIFNNKMKLLNIDIAGTIFSWQGQVVMYVMHTVDNLILGIWKLFNWSIRLLLVSIHVDCVLNEIFDKKLILKLVISTIHKSH